MSKEYERLKEAEKVIREITDFVPEVALVLGSGLGNYAEQMEVVKRIPYTEIKGFPVSTVEGHDGCYIFGYVNQVPVVAMKGRVHYYEGYTMEDVCLPIRLMGLLGAKKLILTNAAGGVNESFNAGDFMIITDHISAFVPSPLVGKNIEELGTRFPDMSEVYSKELSEKAREAAKEAGINIHEGVYFQFSGPNFETPQEVRMIRTLGGDATGMSTACEAIAAKHMGLEICGISCISNMAAGVQNMPLRHGEVQETTDRVSGQFQKIITGLISKIG